MGGRCHASLGSVSVFGWDLEYVVLAIDAPGNRLALVENTGTPNEFDQYTLGAVPELGGATLAHKCKHLPRKPLREHCGESTPSNREFAS